MDNVSLTYFLDFVLKAGTPKLTVVEEFKKRDEYDPRTDFYKPLWKLRGYVATPKLIAAARDHHTQLDTKVR